VRAGLLRVTSRGDAHSRAPLHRAIRNFAALPVLLKQGKIEFVDDVPGKPVGINRFIGKRPVFAFGNSDGDQQMLEWTAADSGARFMGLVHHTDAERESAYDRKSYVGRLDKAWEEAVKRSWTVTNMKTEWKKIFPFEP